MVMSRVAKCFDGGPSQASTCDGRSVFDYEDEFRRDRQRIAVPTLVAGAVHRARPSNQACRIDEVPGTSRMNENRHTFASEVSGGSSVIKMNVGDEEPSEIGGAHSVLSELRADGLEGDSATTFNKYGCRWSHDEERASGARNIQVICIKHEARHTHHRSLTASARCVV